MQSLILNPEALKSVNLEKILSLQLFLLSVSRIDTIRQQYTLCPIVDMPQTPKYFFFKSVALLNNITESETRLEEMSSPQGFPNPTLFQVDRNIYLMFSSANYCAKFEAIKAPLIISKSKKDFVKYLGKQRTVSLAP